MFFKKKEITHELTDEQLDKYYQLRTLRAYKDDFDSDYRFGRIDKQTYDKYMTALNGDIEKLEEEYND